MEGKHDFHLSTQEFEYLKQLASPDETLADLLRSQVRAHGRGLTARLSRTEAEHLRDCLTRQLAAVGFDKGYSPNEQGQMLEELIDRFYVC